MFLRDPAAYKTFDDVRDKIDFKGDVVSATSTEIKLDLNGEEPSITVKNRVVPVTDEGVVALAVRLDVPAKFAERLPRPLLQPLLRGLLDRQTSSVHAVRLSEETGIIDVRAQGAKVIEPTDLVRIAEKVVGKDAVVTDWWCEPGREFRLDAITSIDEEDSLYGDFEVGDLTAAGLRISHNLRQSDQFHTPEVSLLTYRLACTNGAEDVTTTGKVDARGLTLEDILIEFEELAERAFSQAEDTINAFYDMRERRLSKVEQRLYRLGRDYKVDSRLIHSLAERAPALTDDDDTMSEFDLVNMITNEANNPDVRRAGPRRTLQRLGGTLVNEHAVRCAHCQGKL